MLNALVRRNGLEVETQRLEGYSGKASVWAITLRKGGKELHQIVRTTKPLDDLNFLDLLLDQGHQALLPFNQWMLECWTGDRKDIESAHVAYNRCIETRLDLIDFFGSEQKLMAWERHQELPKALQDMLKG